MLIGQAPVHRLHLSRTWSVISAMSSASLTCHPMQVSVNGFAGVVFLGPGLWALHEADGLLAGFLERTFDLQRFHHCRSAVQWLEATLA